jgi:hypothetical protein
MRRSHVEIDVEALRRMYVDERMTTADIAVRLGCGTSTVGRQLRRLGIQPRVRGPRLDLDRSGCIQGTPRWSAPIAWVVGLIATDGNLASAGHRITLTSTDVDLLRCARSCLALSNQIGWSSGGLGAGVCRLQWRHRAFYEWLIAIGLTSRKSLTIGALKVPDEYFPDFFRGCVDGDGTVLVYTDRHHAARNTSYVYDRLFVSLVCGSRPFLEWIEATILRLVGLPDGLHAKQRPGARPVWVLRYSKRASVKLLAWMYYAPDVPCLARKRRKAEPFIPRQKEGILMRRAGVSELADDSDSKSDAREGVGVRVPSPAPPLHGTTPSLTTPGPGRYRGRSVGL